MTDTPGSSDVPPPTDGAGPAGPGGTGDGEAKPWYMLPAVWIGAAAAAIAIIVIIVVASSGGDDEEDVNAGDATPSATAEPTEEPTEEPTAEPTEEPTAEPTEEPTAEPTEEPTAEPTEEPTAEPTEEPTEPPDDMVDMPASGVTGVLAAYAAFPEDTLPFPDGSVTAHWYQWEGSYVVVYAGWFVDDSTSWCPGNSIAKPPNFESISNGPVGADGCEPAEAYEGSPTMIVEPPLGPRVCGALVVYTTTIPVEGSDGAGNELYGTVERYDEAGFVGSTSQAPVDVAAVPELDPGAPGYRVPAGFLPDDATEVSCDA